MLKLRKQLCIKALLLLSLATLLPTLAQAEIVEDWGTIATPLEEDLTFNFAQTEVTRNFTDEYTFALEGDGGASYEVTFNVDFCTYGCGNIDLSYGIYDLNGNLVTEVAADGTVVLESGDYSFQVKGTGFGAGNSLDYFGSVTFSAMASPAPEPPAYLLLIAGLAIAFIARLRRRCSQAQSLSPDSGTVTTLRPNPCVN